MSRYDPSLTRQNLRGAGIDLNLVTEHQNHWALTLGDGRKICWCESTY